MYNEIQQLNRKFFKESVYKILGGGCSRCGALLTDGTVVKIPKIGVYREHAGESERDVFYFLLTTYLMDNPTDKRILKLKQYAIDECLELPISCQNNAVEFLFTYWIKTNYPEQALTIAQCIDINVRKMRTGQIEVITRYEDARSTGRQVRGFNGMIGEFRISDLHDGNYVRGLLVDYACIRYSGRW